MNAFSNDGSFMEQFLKKQKTEGSDDVATTTTTTDNNAVAGYDATAQQYDMSAYYQDPAAMYAQYYQDPAYAQYFAQLQSSGMMDPSMMGAYGGGGGGGGMGGYGQQNDRSNIPSKVLWAGNIPQETCEDDLRPMFGPFGHIKSIKIVPKGRYAFITYAELDSAIQAQAALQNQSIHGVPMRLGFGNNKETSNMGPNDTQNPPSRNLWIGNLDASVSEEQLRQVFEEHGPVDHVKILFGRRCAFVNFDTTESASQARQMLQGKNMNGFTITINFRRFQNYDQSGNPLPSAPPQSAKEQTIIDKMADYVARNGPRFESYTQEKQRENQKFAFLNTGHPYHDYYRWKLWTIKNPDFQEFKDILKTLNSSRGSITSCKSWIMTHASHALEIISIITTTFLANTLVFGQKLNILHVLNDSLHNSFAKREKGNPEQVDEFAGTIQNYLPYIVGSTGAGESPENQEKVIKVLNIWENQKIYPKQFIESLRMAASQDEQASTVDE
eukprot:gene10902-12707_t